MVSRTNLENGVATLATLWGLQPDNVADRLAINLDFSHVEPKPLGERARRALRHENTKYTTKHLPSTSRALAPIVASTAQMIDTPKTFQKLRSMLMKAAYAKTQARMDAEDLVQETILRLCTYEIKDEDQLFSVARQVLRQIFRYYWRKQYTSPAVVTPHEDFHIMEEVFGFCDEDEEVEATAVSPTSDITEAFLRVAAELIKQLGKKHAAVACGLREKTFSRLLPL